mmetsp:Transcript_40021/g.58865  ORF Transcript_40021/g.58865 Transcript_40021/m.58865 type:complete len:814 (+) Transcript_40021:93-2534(+)
MGDKEAVAQHKISSEKYENTELLLPRLARWSQEQPDKLAHSFYKDDGETLVQQYTYREFDVKTRALSRMLVASKKQGGYGIKPGTCVMLVYPPSLDFMVAFVACLRVGIIAVPVFPPDPTQLRKSLFMFTSIQEDCGATVALTNSLYSWAKKISSIKNFFSRSSTSWPEMTWIQTDGTLKEIPLEIFPEVNFPDEEEVAFLQYTSGSTSAPKGVVLKHGTLSHNLGLICRSIGGCSTTLEVAWLPQYHDMGLIGAYLGCLYCGGTGHYVSPISFLRDPVVWLKMLSKYQATHTQIPNFALRLALRKYNAKKEKPELDLSKLDHIFNAAEPILPEDCKDFFDTFGPMGLKTTAIAPGYGLAEHTVYVCDGSHTILTVEKESIQKSKIVIRSQAALDKIPAHTPDNCHNLVSCGNLGAKGNPSVKLIIVDMETLKRKNDDEVGEIWIDSPSKAAGYWGNKQKSEEDFFAAGPPADGDPEGFQRKYLRTGDLGFIHDSELYVCGRSKDLIIIRGRNHYPQDLERCIEKADPLLRPGCSAAFSVPSTSGEQLVIVAEVRDAKELGTAAEARQRVQVLVEELMRTYGVGPNVVVIIRPRTVPKTTSGKIARSRAKRSYMGNPQSKEDELQVLFKWTQGDVVVRSEVNVGGGSKTDEPSRPRNDALLDSPEAKKLLASLKEEIILLLPEDSGVTPESIDERRSLLQLGLDSMLLEQFKSTLEAEHNVEVDIEMLFQNVATLETVVELILAPEETLAMLREEVEKNRVEEPEEDSSTSGGGGEKIAPEGSAQPQYVDVDDSEDVKKQESSPCSNSGCVIC